jgi:uncharacterized protein (DUF885 family)
MNRSGLKGLFTGARYKSVPKLLLASALLLWGPLLHAQTQKVFEVYIDQWKTFYPSSAFGEGDKSAAWRFEDFSASPVEDWVALNHLVEKSLLSVPYNAPLNERVDAQVLLRQVRLEIELWEQDKPLSQQPQWYTGKISSALNYVLLSEKLSAAEKHKAVVARLAGVAALCELGVANLTNGNPGRTREGLKSLHRTIEYFENKLLSSSDPWTKEGDVAALAKGVQHATLKMQELADHIQDKVLPLATVPDKFGPEVYTRKLAIFSDNSATPENLPVIALKEIDRVRELMLELAGAWWDEGEREGDKPKGLALLDAALAAMEEDREDNSQDFLRVFKAETQASVEFVVKSNFATVPANRGVIVDLMPPHLPAARFGGVFPPGPFDPDAKTLLYLPSIPDEEPEDAKEGFYRSFNNHFNRMIIAHEIFPGHAMQFIVGLSHASMVRSLFANPYYAEGWASFSEILMLEAGWGDGNKLTRLAHLRKRLENATRAYISVMVHVHGWNRDQVIEFASTRGLLPAQFADNLWDRVSGLYLSLQLTTYFVGFHVFESLWQEEKQRLGEEFVQRDFVDSVLKTGSVPMTALKEIIQQ